MSHFHISVAEWIGEADRIETLDCNRKALEKEKHLSWVISVGWNAMANSRDEVCTDLIDRTECLEGNWKEVIIAGDVRVAYF